MLPGDKLKLLFSFLLPIQDTKRDPKSKWSKIDYDIIYIY